MLLKIVYLLVCRILGLAVLTVRKDQSKEAELLVLRHENAVLRRHAGRVRYRPADRMWFAALARPIPAGAGPRNWLGSAQEAPNASPASASLQHSAGCGYGRLSAEFLLHPQRCIRNVLRVDICLVTTGCGRDPAPASALDFARFVTTGRDPRLAPSSYPCAID